MTTDDPLDAFAGAAFSTRTARRERIGRRRVHARRLARPFRAVRAFREAETVRELCGQYLPKMAPHAFFSHRTAAVLHRMWLPLPLARWMVVDVSVAKPHRAPRDPRVLGHHLVPRPGLVMTTDGMRLSNPVETLCQLAVVLEDDDLVIAAESLLTPWHENRRSTLQRIVRAFSDPHRPDAARLGRVLPRIRMRSRSASESRFRIQLVADGLREPAINLRWQAPDGEWFEGDLVYQRERVWIEVEGDQHRTDRRQWRKDVARYER